MSSYFFGCGNGKVSDREYKRCERIARKHGADFTRVNMPDGPRYWFETPNRGSPFDQKIEHAVMTEVGRVLVK